MSGLHTEITDYANDVKLEAVASELHEALNYMYQKHICGCGHPACNRCDDDLDNGEILSRTAKLIGIDYE